VQDEAPDWVSDAIRQFAGELRSFLRTAVDVTIAPVRFAREWGAGQRHALNPLGFLATSFAIAGAANVLFAHLVHENDESTPLLLEVLGALTPYVYYVALGSLQHGVLRLFGSRRHLRDSCAMALYAGGGPATVAHVMLLVSATLLFRATGTFSVKSVHQPFALAMIIGAIFSFGLFLTSLSAAQAGLHLRDGIRSWQVAAANVLALLVTGFLFALLHPPGSFGLHFVCGPGHDATGWHFRWGLYD
jgi:hypothetical protein